MKLRLICLVIFFNCQLFADSLSDTVNTDLIVDSSSAINQQLTPFYKRIHIQYLCGAGNYDFPDFNTDYVKHGQTPGYRPGLSLGAFTRIVLNKTFFYDPGIHLIYASDKYQQLNTDGLAISSFDDLEWTKIMLSIGFGTGFKTNMFVFSIRAGIVGDFSLTKRKTSIGEDSFYSFGIGVDFSAQFEIIVTPFIGIPLRAGYGSSASTSVKRFVALWDEHWYDYITQKNKTQKYNGPYLMTGIICYIGKKVF